MLEKEQLEHIYGKIGPSRKREINITREEQAYLNQMKDLREYPFKLAAKIAFSNRGKSETFSEKSQNFMRNDNDLKRRLGYK